MARRENDLFIGTEYLNVDGPAIKHVGLVRHFGTININKIADEPIRFTGLDLETNHITGELKLLGFYDDDGYKWYTDDFVTVLYSYVKRAHNDNTAIAYWNRLDPYILFKQFLNMVDEPTRNRAMDHFGKIGGEWNRDQSTWDVEPVVRVKMGRDEFGILNVIRSSIQFYYKNEFDEQIKKVWAYDIAQLYQSGLEKESSARLPYYSKVDQSAHLVDWDRFNTDLNYKFNIVLKSNELDARAVRDLGVIIQEEFKKAFGHYPRTLVSQGSLARAAIVALITDEHGDDKEQIKNDIKSIGIINYHDEWLKAYGADTLKNIYNMTMEAYSGGYIEAIRYGYAPEAYYSDIASAYPGVIVNLYDLRGATIQIGNGEPPTVPNSYCFIRGTVNIPDDINFHPITVKHPVHRGSNIRAVGEYRASYIKEERDYLLTLGATFTDEEWINIETTGQLSPLAKVARQFINLRKKLRKEGNSAQHMAKIAVNSMYGILYECVDTYTETVRHVQETHQRDDEYTKILGQYTKSIDLSSVMQDVHGAYDKGFAMEMIGRWHKNGGISLETVIDELAEQGIHMTMTNLFDQLLELNRLYTTGTPLETFNITEWDVIRAGYRAGEFFNPIFATYITGITRLNMAKAANAIEDQGGKVILMMTDSVFWTGTPDMLPSDLWKEEKTLGYFERPERVTDMLALGAGRYGYTDKDGRQQTKQRGLNSATLSDANGVQLETFDWFQALKMADRTKADKLNINVRTLLSVGYIANNNGLSWKDLGRVIQDNRELEIIVGASKRVLPPHDITVDDLLNGLTETEPIYIGRGMFGRNGVPDLTYPELRAEMVKRTPTTLEQRHKKHQKRVSDRHYKNNKEQYKEKAKRRYISNQERERRRQNYQELVRIGYSVEDARRMSKWSDAKLDQIFTRFIPLPAL